MVAALGNPSVSLDTEMEFARKGERSDSSSLAQKANLHVEVILLLALSDDRWVRQCIANQPNCPIGVLEELVGDSAARVRACVATDTRLSRESLKRLAVDEDELVRTAAFWNPTSDDEIRTQASLIGVRAGLAGLSPDRE
jgi:hypothetical protein